MDFLLSQFAVSLEGIPSPIAVAVSGGVDSLALLILAQQWAQGKGERIVALTVDHGLRSESSAEVLRVQQWVGERGIEHIILKWEEKKPTSRLQEKAREARYELLLSWCKAHNVSTLLLGHHHQDQEETFWLRLAAGSGLDGLVGMRGRTEKEGIVLLRPLLEIKQDHLRELLKAEKQEWIEDPSNESQRFFRGRFRTFLKEEGLTMNRLSKSIKKFQEDADFIQFSFQQALKEIADFHKAGYVSLQRDLFNGLHPALAKRILAYLVQWFTKPSYGPRSQKIDGILEKLKTGAPFTAGGIYWFHQQGRLYLARELSAFQSPLLLRDIQEKTLWDQRFGIDPEIKRYLPEEAHVGALKNISFLKGHSNNRASKQIQDNVLKKLEGIPRRIWATLLAVWVKEEVVAIPHLCYTLCDSEKDLEKFIYLRPLFTIR